MARTVTTAFKQAAFAEETGEAVLMLLTFNHSSFAEPLRVVHNGAAVVSRGETYLATTFQLIMPGESADSPPQARLAICNVDREIVNALRALSSSPTVTMELVLSSTPDTVEAEFADLELRDVSYDAMVIEGTLSYENLLEEPFPGDKFTPVIFKALFG